jgi:hypothetical protein
LKVTVPVGVPPPGAATAIVGVRVTDCPNTDGFVPEVTVAVVEPLLTFCVNAEDAGDAAKLVSLL